MYTCHELDVVPVVHARPLVTHVLEPAQSPMVRLGGALVPIPAYGSIIVGWYPKPVPTIFRGSPGVQGAPPASSVVCEVW